MIALPVGIVGLVNFFVKMMHHFGKEHRDFVTQDGGIIQEMTGQSKIVQTVLQPCPHRYHPAQMDPKVYYVLLSSGWINLLPLL